MNKKELAFRLVATLSIVPACVFIALFLIAGCKTTNQKAESKAAISEQKDIDFSEKKESNIHLLESIETSENLNTVSKMLEKMLFVFWSTPDSLGRQYPVATGEVNRQTDSNQASKKNTNKDTSLLDDSKQKTDLEDKSKTDAKVGTKETVTETKKIPAGVVWLGLTLVIGIVALWLLKR
jgi:hypothetical protein